MIEFLIKEPLKRTPYFRKLQCMSSAQQTLLLPRLGPLQRNLKTAALQCHDAEIRPMHFPNGSKYVDKTYFMLYSLHILPTLSQSL